MTGVYRRKGESPQDHAARERERYANDPEYRRKKKQHLKQFWERVAADPERSRKWKKKTLEYSRIRNYKLYPDDYEFLLDLQNGKCAVCATDSPNGKGKTWHVDHDHVTGKVRGLLCYSCNIALGHFHDSIAIISAAKTYLQKHLN